MFLLIYKLDQCTNEKPVCILNQGEYIIGRGDLLKCHDKRASRTHAVIKFNNGNATITSTHQNPCFFQSCNSTTVVILTKDVPIELKDGDKFGIFPDEFWFKAKFEKECHSLNSNNHTDDVSEVTEAVTSHKRHLEESLGDVPCKTVRLENGNLSVSDNAFEANGVVEEFKDRLSEETSVQENNSENSTNVLKEELSDSDVEECVSDNLQGVDANVQSNDVNSDNKDKTEEPLSTSSDLATPTVDNTEEAKPSSSGTAGATQSADDPAKTVRDRCWYGNFCYRKCARHKREFCHPGDSDYDSDPNDTRLICRYGVHCYRKNKDHHNQYRHPRTTTKPPPKRQCRKKRDNSKKCKPSTNESSEDDYDYEDPFLNDDSEDDYEGSCSECDSDDDDDDWTEANNLDEDDDEDTKTLMKEAKRFTRQKK